MQASKQPHFVPVATIWVFDSLTHIFAGCIATAMIIGLLTSCAKTTHEESNEQSTKDSIENVIEAQIKPETLGVSVDQILNLNKEIVKTMDVGSTFFDPSFGRRFDPALYIDRKTYLKLNAIGPEKHRVKIVISISTKNYHFKDVFGQKSRVHFNRLTKKTAALISNQNIAVAIPLVHLGPGGRHEFEQIKNFKAYLSRETRDGVDSYFFVIESYSQHEKICAQHYEAPQIPNSVTAKEAALKNGGFEFKEKSGTISQYKKKLDPNSSVLVQLWHESSRFSISLVKKGNDYSKESHAAMVEALELLGMNIMDVNFYLLKRSNRNGERLYIAQVHDWIIKKRTWAEKASNIRVCYDFTRSQELD